MKGAAPVNTLFKGRFGESAAASYLKKKGYKIVGMGYRTRFGEIDIIAENKDYIVFAEVKSRKSGSFARAMEYVDSVKQRRIRTTAQIWLSKNTTSKQPRFDVLEVYGSLEGSNGDLVINHIENAF